MTLFVWLAIGVAAIIAFEIVHHMLALALHHFVVMPKFRAEWRKQSDYWRNKTQ